MVVYLCCSLSAIVGFGLLGWLGVLLLLLIVYCVAGVTY